MYELNNKVRLIDVSEFMVENSSEFLGFICGIISQDRDLEKMFLDSFLKVAYLEDCDIPVSYTHLDVYKRQVWGALPDTQISSCAAGIPMVMAI